MMVAVWYPNVGQTVPIWIVCASYWTCKRVLRNSSGTCCNSIRLWLPLLGVVSTDLVRIRPHSTAMTVGLLLLHNLGFVLPVQESSPSHPPHCIPSFSLLPTPPPFLLSPPTLPLPSHFPFLPSPSPLPPLLPPSCIAGLVPL